LPHGRVRDRFPLVTCTQDVKTCVDVRSIWEEMGGARLQWSPNGRYLAFVAILDGISSDLFVYDAQNSNLRRLTHGPDWVGPIEWSPDGTQIVMQEYLNQDLVDYGPSFAVPSSVWAVSLSTNEIRLLLTGNAYMHHNILRWLDDRRFIAYEGSLLDPMYGALNLRVVDMETGTSRMLFDDWFVMHNFDPIHETLAIIKQGTEKSPDGIYLVSIKTGTVRRLEQPPYLSWDFRWDSGTGLFVTIDDCQNDPQSLQAFDYQANFSCVPRPTQTPEPMEIASYPAPNGISSISVKGGLWLETESKPAIQVSPETASDIIWCPDSSCFFFSVLKQNQQWTLYHVSLVDLTIRMVDEGIQSTGSYKWLGVEQ
jgi:dipeptidyl aminopeptidase/acylaminoacyl peptidase